MVFMILVRRPSKSFSVCFKTVNNSSTSSREHSDSMHSVDLFKTAMVSSSDKMALCAVVYLILRGVDKRRKRQFVVVRIQNCITANKSQSLCKHNLRVGP